MGTIEPIPTEEISPLRIVVVGAGAIGCFVGCSLQYASDQDRLSNNDKVAVTLVSRSRLKAQVDGTDGVVSMIGLHLDRYACRPKVVQDMTEDLKTADVVIVAVKSTSTKAVGESIGAMIQSREESKPPLLVYSFQNGVSNKGLLENSIKPPHRVVSCMVEMNVVWEKNAHFYMTSEGAIYLEEALKHNDPLYKTHERFAQALAKSMYYEPVRWPGDFRNVLYSKLLVNLINPVNAMAGCSIAQLLQNRGYRMAWALLWEEALGIIKIAGIHPISLKTAPGLFPSVCRLPTVVWNIIAKLKGAHTRESAKTSMLVDIENGDPTEISYLCGAVVDLGKEVGKSAPYNERMVKLIRDAEENGKGSPCVSSSELLKLLKSE